MKAIQAAERGGYEALRLVDIPQPQRLAGHALVRVTSAGVTPLDRTVLAGLHPRAKKGALVPGNEGAGVVTEDMSAIEDFRIGAIGASKAVLVAEELFASGCHLAAWFRPRRIDRRPVF